MTRAPSLRDLLTRQPMQGGEFPPALDPRGRWVAFCTRVRPDGENAARYSESGVPISTRGLNAHVVDLETGAVHDLGEPGDTSWRPSFSPDSTRIAYYMAVAGGPPQLWLRDLTTQTSRAIAGVTVKPKLWAGDAPIWSLDGGSIFVPVPPIVDVAVPASAAQGVAAEPSTSVTVMRSGQRSAAAAKTFYRRDNLCAVARVEVISGRVETIVADTVVPSPAVFQLSPSGEWLSYLSVFRREESGRVHDLAVVRSSGGSPRTIASGLPVADDEYCLHSYVWHPHQDRLLWIEQDVVRSLDFSDAATVRTDIGLGTSAAVWPMSFTSTGAALIVAVRAQDKTAAGDEEVRELAVVDLAASAPVERVRVPLRCRDLSIIEASPRVTWQPDSVNGIAVSIQYPGGEAAVLSLESDREPLELWRGPGRLSPIGVGADDRLIVLYQDLNVPPDLFSVQSDTNSLRRLTSTEPAFIDHDLGTRREVHTSLRVDDVDLELRTTVIEPSSDVPTRRGTTIVIGYPGSRCLLDGNTFGGGDGAGLPTGAFLMSGFRVILVDLPLGSQRPETTLAERITHLLMSQLESATPDGAHGLGLLALMGHSYGAYGVGEVLTRTREFAAGIASSGMYDPASYGAHVELDTGLTKWTYITQGQGRMMSDPWTDPARYVLDSPFYRADQIATPMLLIHGDRDHAYPATESTKLFSALEHLGRAPVELAVYHGEGHDLGDWPTTSQIDVIERIIRFLTDLPPAGHS